MTRSPSAPLGCPIKSDNNEREGVIVVIAALLVWYAWAQRKRDVLR